jgi:hypothetical protein
MEVYDSGIGDVLNEDLTLMMDLLNAVFDQLCAVLTEGGGGAVSEAIALRAIASGHCTGVKTEIQLKQFEAVLLEGKENRENWMESLVLIARAYIAKSLAQKLKNNVQSSKKLDKLNRAAFMAKILGLKTKREKVFDTCDYITYENFGIEPKVCKDANKVLKDGEFPTKKQLGDIIGWEKTWPDHENCPNKITSRVFIPASMSGVQGKRTSGVINLDEL